MKVFTVWGNRNRPHTGTSSWNDGAINLFSGSFLAHATQVNPWHLPSTAGPNIAEGEGRSFHVRDPEQSGRHQVALPRQKTGMRPDTMPDGDHSFDLKRALYATLAEACRACCRCWPFEVLGCFRPCCPCVCLAEQKRSRTEAFTSVVLIGKFARTGWYERPRRL